MIDGVWGTIFRYVDVFDRIAAFGLLENQPKLNAWREAVAKRPSFAHAPPEGYSERLEQFLRDRRSYISLWQRRLAPRLQNS